AEEQGARRDEPIVESQARDDHVGAVPEQLAERHASGSLRARPAARMVGMPIVPDPEHAERHTLVDPDGIPLARYVHVLRDGRVVADLFELEVPVQRALPYVLAELRDTRIAGSEELGRALVAAGARPHRHSHAYSHDLRDLPPVPPGFELTAVDRPATEL